MSIQGFECTFSFLFFSSFTSLLFTFSSSLLFVFLLYVDIRLFMGDAGSGLRFNTHEILYFLVSQAKKFEDLRDEYYCQLLNQLINNPSEFFSSPPIKSTKDPFPSTPSPLFFPSWSGPPNRKNLLQGLKLLFLFIPCFLPQEELVDCMIVILKNLAQQYELADHCLARLRWACSSRFSLRVFPPSNLELEEVQVCFTTSSCLT